ncbi:hypothetical protein JMJ35_009560 [Cladonia borealis]|uniref:Uncharacterized protein n=1 Tax=Cladonia borealis TaxID=184061 RepID=A0AA39U4K4_9LECA|nr:hypothetical protein JMJ35_009560 [Cladonia borealis]
MTLVWGVSNGLQQLQLGFNELASALVVGKIVGTAFTRHNDAEVFSILEKSYEVRFKAIPEWMQSFQFSRAGVIHGQGMRRLNCTSMMDNIDVESLQGFASIVVLCCRFVMSTNVIVGILEDFLGFGHEAIYPGKLGDPGTRLSLPVKALLANFVRATIDSDGKSQQATNAVKWMADLANEVGVSARLKIDERRAHEYNRHLIAKLMGEPKRSDGAEDGLPRKAFQRVEHTLSMATATIALAAAANGADVSVQCITLKGIKTIPQHASSSKFVLRLWLRQPPLEISNFLSYAEAKKRGEDGKLGAQDGIYSTIIFGGNMEIALNVGQAIGYGDQDHSGLDNIRIKQRLYDLWMKGVRKGNCLKWEVEEAPLKRRRESEPLPQPRIRLMDHENIISIPPEADCLIDVLNTLDERLNPLARAIATIIHDVYHYSDYSRDQSGHFAKAMELVSIAISVGLLQAWTFAPAKDIDLYALQQGAIRRNGALREFLPVACTEGFSHQSLLWAAATLWGGASAESQGGVVVGDRVMGIVAPHCTIILEILRDPISFARSRMSGPMLVLLRGSMPLLPRSARSGFVLAADVAHIPRAPFDCGQASKAMDLSNLPRSLAGDGPLNPENELVITIEPNIESGSSASVFCGWFAGDLNFEIDPLVAFNNLIRKPRSRELTRDPQTMNRAVMSSIDLLDITQFQLANGFAIFNTHSDPVWLLVAAGCAEDGSAIVLEGSFDDARHMISRCFEGKILLWFEA